MKRGVDIASVCDLVAERVVVGSLLTDCTDVSLTAYRESGCTPADWIEESTATALRVYLRAVEARGIASFADVLHSEEARKHQELAQHVLNLCNETSSNLQPYLRSVRVHAEQRKAMRAIERELRRASDATTPDERLDALSAAKAIHVPSLDPNERVLTKAERLAALYAEDVSGVEKLPAVSTSLTHLDRLMAGGFRAGRLYVLSARPGGGKTSLALAMMAAACRAGRRVAFVSLEMETGELERRLVSYLSGVPLLGNRAATDEEAVRLQNAYGLLAEWDYHIWDRPPRSYDEVVRWLCALHEEAPLGLVVLDYLQLLPSTGAERDDLSIGQHATRSKNAAKILSVPFVMLAQPNRAIEQRGDGRYKMSDLRGSGQIEQDADWIAFLWQPPEGAEGYPQGYAEIDVAKHRHGPKARIRVQWDGATYRFSDAEDYLPLSAGVGNKFH